MTLFALDNVSVRYGRAEVLHDVNLRFDSGEFVAITGPNGAGKSTLLSVLARLKPPSSGECLFNGRDLKDWNGSDFARKVAVVLQETGSDFPFTAEDVVYMGRLPHHSGLYETAADNLAVEKALERTETVEFRLREFRTLSGGEKQRVLMASALAQSPEVLLLDEPSSHLDLHHQVHLYRLLRELARAGLLVIAITHDLNLSLAHTDRTVVLHKGCVRADAPPGEIMLQTALLSNIFDVSIELHQSSAGRSWITYDA